jgi:hypothetical protein
VGSSDLVISKVVPVNSANKSELSIYFEAQNVVLGSGEEILVGLEHLVSVSAGVEKWCPIGNASIVDVVSDGMYGILLSETIKEEALILPASPTIRMTVNTGGSSSFDLLDPTYGESIL